jgi:hypothetical protein
LRNPDKAKHWFNLGCQEDIAEMEDGAALIESDLDADSDIASGPEWLSRALLQLPFRQRAVIELSYGIGLSCDENLLGYAMHNEDGQDQTAPSAATSRSRSGQDAPRMTNVTGERSK